MLIGAHVSTAGGLAAALRRAEDQGCEAMQIFNQSPRQWRPTAYTGEDFAEFATAHRTSPVGPVVIHAVYLLNCASPDPVIREKTLASLRQSLRVGDAIGSSGIVLHPGSRKTDPHAEAMERIAAALRVVLADSERCPILLENTAGAGGTIGRDFGELARLIELCDGDERLGVCLDCCHLHASGYDCSNAEAIAGWLDDFDAEVGLDRLRCLHVNDSKTPLGSNRDRHANVGEGELGPEGIGAFLSEPSLQNLPALLETPGPEGKGADAAELERARELRVQGLRARS
ncbi:MAG: deoxyribonuclease IV [Solirubrobacterales bacterium]